MKLEDLLKRAGDMTEDQLREELRGLRRQRGVVKAPPPKKAKASDKDPFVELAGALDTMSPDDLKTLLGMVEGDGDG